MGNRSFEQLTLPPTDFIRLGPVPLKDEDGIVPGDPVESPYSFAFHVLNRLEAEGQMSRYMTTGAFVADAFMTDQLAVLLREKGIAISPEEIWQMAVEIRFDPIPDDISELDSVIESVAA